MAVKPPPLFSNMCKDVRPIATPSRNYSQDDKKIITDEINSLLTQGIIEKSNSPWRAQVLIVRQSDKNRMVIDYSRTINRFTYADAHQVPRINTLVQTIAKFNIFRKIDLRNAYHQIPLQFSDKPFTAFEANGSLYQFTRLPFGLTNAVSVFQRTMNTIISDNKLVGSFAYLDDVLICGKT